MSKSLLLLVIFAIGECAELTLVAQQAPKLLPFQSRLTDQNGIAVSNGVRLVQFKIFDVPTDGNPVWSGELHRTTVNGGLVNVLLGTKTPFAGLDFNKQLYLEITVDINGDNAITAADPPMLPRQIILPVIFATESANSRLLSGEGWQAILANGATNPVTGRIDGAKVANASIVGSQLVNGTVTSNQIAPQTINSTLIAPGTITSSQIAPATIIASNLAPTLLNTLCPPGTIVAYMGSSAPSGWLLCDGSEVSRSQYAQLFATIGDSNGTGDGSSTFRLPDLRGMFLRGVNGTRSDAFADPDKDSRSSLHGGNSGNNVGSAQQDELKSHRHHVHPPSANSQLGGGNITEGSDGVELGINFDTDFTGGNETRPKNVYVNYIIKY